MSFNNENEAGPSTSVTTNEDNKLSNENNPLPIKTGKTHTILVNPKQRGNPLLKCITNVPWEYDDIVPDYQMGANTCALFLSMRYHNLNPDYIHSRLKLLGNAFEVRVLLLLADVKDSQHILKHLSKICILANMTLFLASSSEEAGKIIETYKIYENKPPDKIMGKNEDAVYLKILDTLTAVDTINSTDAMILLQKFRTLENVINATEYQLGRCPGFGEHKAKKLYDALHADFCIP